jgi:DNA adenine methylase
MPKAGLVSYYGGKMMIAKKIIAFFPKNHITYVEPFCGGGSVLLQKEPSKIEVLNDNDEYVVNFFRVLQQPDKFEKFQRIITLTPWSRKVFDHAKANMAITTNDVYKAVYWFIVLRQSFSSMSGTWSYDIISSTRNMLKNISGNISGWFGAIDLLPEFVKRLMRVQFECGDYSDIIKRYDRPITLFYVDPPYWNIQYEYRHTFTKRDHIKMLVLLKQVSGKVVLSGYRNEVYDRMLKSWNRMDINTFSSASLTKRNARVESLWMNF